MPRKVPRKVLWWALRSLGIEEWAVRVIQGMYVNARSRVRVNGQYSEKIGVGVGVHQGSVLSPLLFILVLEVLSREFRTGVPWEPCVPMTLWLSRTLWRSASPSCGSGKLGWRVKV